MSEKEKDLETLLAEAEEVAKRLSDGHLSCLKFTKGWKCCAGTPCLMPLWPDSEYLWALPGHPTLEQALKDFIKRRHVFPANDGCY